MKWLTKRIARYFCEHKLIPYNTSFHPEHYLMMADMGWSCDCYPATHQICVRCGYIRRMK